MWKAEVSNKLDVVNSLQYYLRSVLKDAEINASRYFYLTVRLGSCEVTLTCDTQGISMIYPENHKLEGSLYLHTMRDYLAYVRTNEVAPRVEEVFKALEHCEVRIDGEHYWTGFADEPALLEALRRHVDPFLPQGACHIGYEPWNRDMPMYGFPGEDIQVIIPTVSAFPLSRKVPYGNLTNKRGSSGDLRQSPKDLKMLNFLELMERTHSDFIHTLKELRAEA